MGFLAKRWVSYTVAVILGVTIFLTGCGANKEDQVTQTQESASNQGEVEGQEVATSGFPVSQEPITLHFMGPKAAIHGPWNDSIMFKEYEKMTNMHIEFEDVPESGYTEKLNLVLASNELPDVFIRAKLSPMDVAKYGPTGAFLPLDDLIDGGYAPNLTELFEQYTETRTAVTSPDGHMYTLPGIVTLDAARTAKHWVNKKWLETLNIEVPTTLDELKQMLIAFKENDMNNNGDAADEIPITGNGIAQLINEFGNSYGLDRQMRYQINIENDKVNIWYDDERYKEVLMFLTDLYQEGILDQEIFIQKYEDFIAKINPDKLGFFFNQTDDVFSQYADDFAGLGAFKGPNGDQIKSNQPIARDFGTFTITTVNKYPKETMRWIDYFYGEEGSRFFRMGIEGQTYVQKEDGSYVYTDEINNDERGIGVAIGQFTIWPGGGAPHLINEQNSVAINSPGTQRAQEALEPYMVKKVYAMPIFDMETQQRVTSLTNDIDTYVAETRAKFITGSLSFDKWDEYLATLDKIGLKELEEIYQKGYDLIK